MVEQSTGNMVEQPDLVFRPRKFYRNLGLESLALFGGAMVLSMVGVAIEKGILAGIAIGGLWGFFVVLSLWMLAAYWKESLSVREGVVLQRGVFRTRQLALADIIEARWGESRCVVLRSAAERIKVYLDNFTDEEQRQLIRWLRLSIPYCRQRDWDRFCYRIALPLAQQSDDRPLEEGDVLRTRAHFDRLLLGVGLVAVVLGIGFAWYLHEAKWLMMPAPFVLFWLVFRWSIPAKGLVMRRQKGFDKRLPWVLVFWIVASIGSQLLLNPWHDLTCGLLWPLMWFFLSMGGMVAIVWWADRRRWERLRGDVERAVEQWESQEVVNRASESP